MSFKKLSTRLLSIAAIAASFAVAAPAQATVILDGSHWKDTYDMDVTENGVTTRFVGYCLEAFDEELLTQAEFGLIKDGVSYFGAQKAELLGQLFTAFDSYLVGAQSDYLSGEKSEFGDRSAIQAAVWLIVDDTLPDSAWLHMNSDAQKFLDAMNPANNYYQVGAYTNPDWQDYLYLSRVGDPSAVPEPGSLALVGLALGGIGGIARRRKALAMKAAA